MKTKQPTNESRVTIHIGHADEIKPAHVDCTIGELLASNNFDASEAERILADLAASGECRIGGGGAQAYTAKLIG